MCLGDEADAGKGKNGEMLLCVPASCLAQTSGTALALLGGVGGTGQHGSALSLETTVT